LLADPISKELPAEERPYAALLVSKIYHYIGLVPDSVDFALKAGVAFEKEPAGEYRDAIIGAFKRSSLDSY
jgi:26S proteasome regulatory subunit N2